MKVLTGIAWAFVAAGLILVLCLPHGGDRQLQLDVLHHTARIWSEKMRGSGFVVAKDRVLTAAHVLTGGKDGAEAPGTAEAEFFGDDGQSLGRAAVRVVAFDRDEDLALLDVPGTRPMPLAAWGEAALLDRVFSVGCPYGFAPILSEGLVTAFFEYRDRSYLLESCPLGDGSSGGVLCKMARGRIVLLGVTAMRQPQTEHITLSIPTRRVLAFLEKYQCRSR